MSSAPRYDTLRLVLGDQLNTNHSWFSSRDPRTLYVIAELTSEATYTTHHIQKLCAFFLAMQSFATDLKAAGHKVLSLKLNETASFSDLSDLLTHAASQYSVRRIEYQRPDEYRLLKQLRTLEVPKVTIEECDTEHFIVPFLELDNHFQKQKPARLEAFYRRLRKQHKILMNSDSPEGGKWNFDASNRKRIKENEVKQVPEPLDFANDISKTLRRIKKHGLPYIGRIPERLNLPVNRRQSLELLDFFCEKCLPKFGDYQDAMTQGSPYGWSMFHSRLSFSLNTKMLSPKEVIERATEEYDRNDDIDISQIEGFVRQILGWREFVRGIYWANMPDYASANYLQADNKLPAFFWSGNTKMNCIAQTVSQTMDHAYAHHIQRLMVTGGFALLAGVSPREVDGWYLGVYADAVEWVQLPNTRGMSQYADGGLMASKPYAASGNYTNKMSDYCRNCYYNVKSRAESNSCPFNSLYWSFIARHRPLLEKNQRIKMAYITWDKFDEDTRSAVLERAGHCLSNLEKL